MIKIEELLTQIESKIEQNEETEEFFLDIGYLREKLLGVTLPQDLMIQMAKALQSFLNEKIESPICACHALVCLFSTWENLNPDLKKSLIQLITTDYYLLNSSLEEIATTLSNFIENGTLNYFKIFEKLCSNENFITECQEIAQEKIANFFEEVKEYKNMNDFIEQSLQALIQTSKQDIVELCTIEEKKEYLDFIKQLDELIINPQENIQKIVELHDQLYLELRNVKNKAQSNNHLPIYPISYQQRLFEKYLTLEERIEIKSDNQKKECSQFTLLGFMNHGNKEIELDFINQVAHYRKNKNQS